MSEWGWETEFESALDWDAALDDHDPAPDLDEAEDARRS